MLPISLLRIKVPCWIITLSFRTHLKVLLTISQNKLTTERRFKEVWLSRMSLDRLLISINYIKVPMTTNSLGKSIRTFMVKHFKIKLNLVKLFISQLLTSPWQAILRGLVIQVIYQEMPLEWTQHKTYSSNRSTWIMFKTILQLMVDLNFKRNGSQCLSKTISCSTKTFLITRATIDTSIIKTATKRKISTFLRNKQNLS